MSLLQSSDLQIDHLLYQYNYADMLTINIQISLKFHAVCAASSVVKWQIFIYQNRIIRIYGHEGMGVI